MQQDCVQLWQFFVNHSSEYFSGGAVRLNLEIAYLKSVIVSHILKYTIWECEIGFYIFIWSSWTVVGMFVMYVLVSFLNRRKAICNNVLKANLDLLLAYKKYAAAQFWLMWAGIVCDWGRVKIYEMNTVWQTCLSFKHSYHSLALHILYAGPYV